MKLASQIRQHRTEMGLSQDALAEREFVSRQTVSNWENDKSYPNINSLVLMAEVFGVSLDNLVKGDIEEMNEKIKAEDIASFKKSNIVMTAVMIWMVFALVPLLKFFGITGAVIYAVFAIIGFCYALKVEKQKKKLDIQTYKEIDAFMEGKRLDEIEKQREIGKRPYQKILLAIVCAIIGFAVTYLMAVIFRLEI